MTIATAAEATTITVYIPQGSSAKAVTLVRFYIILGYRLVNTHFCERLVSTSSHCGALIGQ